MVKSVGTLKEFWGKYGLYLEVLSKAEFVLETLTLDYFRKIEAATPLNSRLVRIKKEDETIGFFLICDSGEEEISVIFAGVDYRWNRQYDTYFNLFYQSILHGFAEKKKKISFGQNGYYVKQRLGCDHEPLYIVFLHRNKLTNIVLGRLVHVLLPEIKIETRKIFKEKK